jgi:hypothetical protein
MDFARPSHDDRLYQNVPNAHGRGFFWRDPEAVVIIIVTNCSSNH